MKAGMMLRSKRRFKDTDRRWFIKKEGWLVRNNKSVKGYRIALLEKLDNGFWVTEEQLHERFEEVV